MVGLKTGALVLGGLGAVGAAGLASKQVTVAMTSKGDWAHPVQYADAVGVTGLGVGAVAGGGLAAIGAGAMATGIGATHEMQQAIVRRTAVLAGGAKVPIPEQKAAYDTLEAATAKLVSSKAATTTMLGAGLALAGVAVIAGFNAGVMKTHERMEKPNIKVDITGTYGVQANVVDNVKNEINSLFDGKNGR
jgi:hypothetical protein